jgi:acyl transferase domain-containing protein
MSAFGSGYTDINLVSKAVAATIKPKDSERKTRVIPISARTPAEVGEARKVLLDYLQESSDVLLDDLAYTLAQQECLSHRLAIVTDRTEELGTALASDEFVRSFRGEARKQTPSVGFVFSGVGDQYAGMGSGLYESEPVYRRTVDQCCDWLKHEMGIDLLDVFRKAPVAIGESTDALRRLLLGKHSAGELARAELAQPAVFVLEYSLARLLESWNVRPDSLIGYSLGEYTAATLAGVFSLEDCLRVVATRARLIGELAAGAMLAVPLNKEALRPWLSDEISLGIDNGPNGCVASGPKEAIDALQRRIVSRRLATSHAFHSAVMDAVVGPLVELIGGMQLSAPSLPILSNVTGDWLKAEQATSAIYWGRHLRETVQFGKGIERLLEDKTRVLLELGPGQSLSSMICLHPAFQDDSGRRLITPTCRNVFDEQPDSTFLLQALARLWVRGVSVDWKFPFQGNPPTARPIPFYLSSSSTE